MKKLILLSAILLFSCSNSLPSSSSLNNQSSNIVTSSSNVSVEEISSSSKEVTSSKESSSSSSISSSKASSYTSSIKQSSSSSSSFKTEANNPDGSKRMEQPSNTPIAIGKDNASISTFEFESSLPENFRFIYGNNFTKPSFYANGGIKISSFTNAKMGLQTPNFISDKKLEIRIHFGDLYNSSQSDKISKDDPVILIYGFNNNAEIVETAEIYTVNKNNENNYIRTYIAGIDVSYLEIRFMQPAYKSSQAYNISFKALSLIAWPYDL